MKFATGLAALTVAIASTLAVGQANAASEQEEFSSNPSARCQPANPASEALVRKRPLAMVNEGAASATVNCAFETEIFQSTTQLISVYASNANAAAVDVTCTGISGWVGRADEGGGALNEYLPLTVSIPAGSQGLPFQWADTDFENGTGGLITVSCALPPGIGINDSYVDYLIDDADEPPVVP